MRLVLKDYVALVTGAAHGIGSSVALEFAQRGCHLALCDLRAEALEATAARARACGVRVSTHLLDIADAAAIERLPDQVLEAHRVVNVLVNNAGVALMGSFEQVSLADFEWLVNINLWGVVRMTKAFLPHLRRADHAHIVNVSSVFGLVAPPGQTAYCLSKFAVRGFTEALRHEVAASGISVTCVHPGGVRTQIVEHARAAATVAADSVHGARERFARIARTSPADAAGQIVNAIESGKPRLLIGADARFMDRVQRLMPIGYWRVIARSLAPRGLRRPRTSAPN